MRQFWAPHFRCRLDSPPPPIDFILLLDGWWKSACWGWKFSRTALPPSKRYCLFAEGLKKQLCQRFMMAWSEMNSDMPNMMVCVSAGTEHFWLMHHYLCRGNMHVQVCLSHSALKIQTLMTQSSISWSFSSCQPSSTFNPAHITFLVHVQINYVLLLAGDCALPVIQFCSVAYSVGLV